MNMFGSKGSTSASLPLGVQDPLLNQYGSMLQNQISPIATTRLPEHGEINIKRVMNGWIIREGHNTHVAVGVDEMCDIIKKALVVQKLNEEK